MARPSTVGDQILLDLIQDYIKEECDGDTTKIKLPAITDYVVRHGYPDYKVTMLRRNPTARAYIDSLKQAGDGQGIQLLAAYKTLDVEAFLDTNRTRDALKRALTDLDGYYKSVADAAIQVTKKYEQAVHAHERAENDSSALQMENKARSRENLDLHKQIKQLQKENKRLTRIVKDYVYPSIANELLSEDGDLVSAKTGIDPRKLEALLMRADSTITNEVEGVSPKNNVVRGLFDSIGE